MSPLSHRSGPAGRVRTPPSRGGEPSPGGSAWMWTSGSGPSAVGEVEQDRLDPAVDVGLLRQAELREDRVDVLLHRPLRKSEGGGDRGVVAALRHLGEDLALAGREELER